MGIKKIFRVMLAFVIYLPIVLGGDSMIIPGPGDIAAYMCSALSGIDRSGPTPIYPYGGVILLPDAESNAYATWYCPATGTYIFTAIVVRSDVLTGDVPLQFNVNAGGEGEAMAYVDNESETVTFSDSNLHYVCEISVDLTGGDVVHLDLYRPHDVDDTFSGSIGVYGFSVRQ